MLVYDFAVQNHLIVVVAAAAVGITRQTVNAIEANKYSPSLEVAFEISRVFRVPLEQVFQYC